jgi:hypothetical protein
MWYIYLLFFQVSSPSRLCLIWKCAELVKLELTYIMLPCKMCSKLLIFWLDHNLNWFKTCSMLAKGGLLLKG